MLQVPEVAIRRAPGRGTANKASRTNANRESSGVSKLRKLIADAEAAFRSAKTAKRKRDALYEKHPDLMHNRPLVLMYVNGDGKKVYGRWITEFNRFFPPHMDKMCPGNVKRRERFVEECEAAYPAHKQARVDNGIEQAEDHEHRAWERYRNAYQAVLLHPSNSRLEFALIADFVLRNLIRRHDGPILESALTAKYDRTEYQEWLQRRSYALFGIEGMLRAAAKMVR